MKPITPCLWFDDNAEEAVNFYVSVFSAIRGEGCRIKDVVRYGKAASLIAGRPEGSVQEIAFELQGQELLALNGGPLFKFSEAISFIIYCRSQDEIDAFWERLSEGSEPGQCGWVKDKYGVTWQVVPENIDALLNQPDAEIADRVFNTMVTMGKLDIAQLEQAAEGGSA